MARIPAIMPAPTASISVVSTAAVAVARAILVDIRQEANACLVDCQQEQGWTRFIVDWRVAIGECGPLLPIDDWRLN
jgi:hypothetical protein